MDIIETIYYDVGCTSTRREIKHGIRDQNTCCIVENKSKETTTYAFLFNGVSTSGCDVDELRRFKKLLNSFKDL